ncbi:SerA Phosphoglycerate dehydrogenase [Pyrenophora tritici-repentis]|nr:NAD binding domain containing protein [Pyrenophora tritici-repentis]KAI1534222.1 SerA Phosphoglycerate dehydrogenase [Pyrenophora tritici-repentis]KAI1537659.1 SerA Phosphoglycerate dehydrogenase [Pyrenophora tritici-repentis]KAI1548043.1 SerA Phosphoglycerate dehydrogenase [Pyrenophora tritici-repentis]KAI1567200.1 SerA Phosphoglycerate dehydrogenase [Pyrenophora tritici-repentis]
MGGGPELPSRGTPKEKELVLCTLPWPEERAARGIKALKEAFDDVEVKYYHSKYSNGNAESLVVPDDVLRRANYMATLFWLPSSPMSIPHTKLIQFYSAGTNHVSNHPIYTDSEIPLCSANGVHGPQIAEWVIMMDLVHSHSYTKLYDNQKKKVWDQADGSNVSDRVGKKVGILGYGSIGRQVARVAKAMAMDVIAYTASPRKTPESKRDVGYIVPGTGDPDGSIPSAWYSGTDKAAMHEFLKQEIDLLVVAVPLTKTTTHLLSTEEFELLHKSNPRGTYVANIARGQIIDQKALITALEQKQISGAALDVTDPEPLPKDDPLWEAPNVLITPHCSGSTDVYADRAFQVLIENIKRDRSGGDLINEVNRKRGY